MVASTTALAPAFLCLLVCAPAVAQPSNNGVIVQPGAPGSASKVLWPSAVHAGPPAPFGPDVEFMQGMIMHHQQACDMVALLRTRGKDPALKSFGEKITLSQSDEIRMMKEWLETRGQPTAMPMDMPMDMDHSHMSMADMKNMNMSMKLMPGMLTPQQMDELAKAKGAKFDHLFLTGMIQHHGGALTMVDDLFHTPGAGQDPVLFDFATDIDNTQRAEIKIMQAMLKKEKP